MKRKIVQLAVESGDNGGLFLLCDDGSVWLSPSDFKDGYRKLVGSEELLTQAELDEDETDFE